MNNRKSILRLVLGQAVLLAVVLTSCAPASTPDASPQATPTVPPAPTFTPAPTSTPVPTPVGGIEWIEYWQETEDQRTVEIYQVRLDNTGRTLVHTIDRMSFPGDMNIVGGDEVTSQAIGTTQDGCLSVWDGLADQTTTLTCDVGQVVHAVFGPDHQVYYLTNDAATRTASVEAVGLDGSNQRQLAQVDGTMAEFSWIWAIDDNSLVLSEPCDLANRSTAACRLWTVALDGSGAQEFQVDTRGYLADGQGVLLSIEVSRTDADALYLFISNGPQLILLRRVIDNSAADQIYVLYELDPDAAPGQSLDFANDVVPFAIWSNDGTQFIWITYDNADCRESHYLWSSVTGETSLLNSFDLKSDQPYCDRIYPAWSPDDRQILFIRSSHSDQSPYATLVDVATREMTDVSSLFEEQGWFLRFVDTP